MFRTRQEFDDANAAARIIELDGVGGYHTCCQRFGEAVANALLTLYLRRGETSPHESDRKLAVAKVLKEHGLVVPRTDDELYKVIEEQTRGLGNLNRAGMSAGEQALFDALTTIQVAAATRGDRITTVPQIARVERSK